MKMFFVCKSHKQVFCAGEAERDGSTELRHHRASADQILLAITRFVYSHCDCDAGWMSEKKLFDMDLHGFRRVDAELGIPFKGPEYMTIDEASDALKRRQSE